MKLALITDTHFGARNDSLIFHSFFKKFYGEFFFPYLEANDIKTVIMGGDTFDRRKYINFLTLDLCKQYFFEEIDRRGIRLIMNIGNHDVFYRNTNTVNSPELLFEKKYELVVDEPIEYTFDSLKMIVVPWITTDNHALCLDRIEKTAAPVLYGHLELAGFEMYKGSVVNHGMQTDPFEKFDMVLTGHYHHKSSRSNVHYLGCPYEITWSDHDDPHGFHVLDTETRELEFVENPYHIFHKLWYDDSAAKTPDQALKEFEGYAKYTDCYLKIIVTSKTKPSWFDMVIDRFEKAGVADLQVVEDHLNSNLQTTEDIAGTVEDTPQILKRYVDALDGISVEKDKLSEFLLGIYNEAVWTSEKN